MHNEQQVANLKHPLYQTYLLRMWQEQPAGPWHVVLQAVGSEEQQGFANPDLCFDFIRIRLLEKTEEEGT